MTDTDILTLLKSDLGEPNAPEVRVAFLQHNINMAKELIQTEGISLSNPLSNEDAGLVIEYAAFLVRKRATTEGMPRYLRWSLNNRLMKEKANV